jgi:5-methylcytosine-specific restriction endonuclease McrA
LFMFHTKTDPFYLSASWRQLRLEVLREQHFECQHCRAKGWHKKATTVHHIKHRDKHPELELSKYYIDERGRRQRNLIALCHECHEIEHGHRHELKKPLTEERW